MLNFELITADNIMKTAEYFKYKISRTSDYTVGAMFMWRDFYETHYAIQDDMLFYKVKFIDHTAFTLPTGGGSLAKAMEALREYCQANQLPLIFCTIPKEAFTTLTEEYHGEAPCCTPNRDWADYLYLAEDLANMAGRRYSGQRNHINKFKKLYPDYSYQRITADSMPRIIDFLLDFQKNHGKESDLAQEELRRALELLGYYEKFNLKGGFIEVGGTIVSIGIGEVVNDTLYCHIEKGNREYEGSYQMIVKEFSNDIYTNHHIQYINREDDVGDEGLRTSKLSYHPVELLDKYCIILP